MDYNAQAIEGSGVLGDRSSILDDRAVEEANKYREELGEKERVWYDDINNYFKYNE